jgi:hypothetical protein
MDFYTVWRFWRFVSSSNLRGLNAAKQIDSRRLHHMSRVSASPFPTVSLVTSAMRGLLSKMFFPLFPAP